MNDYYDLGVIAAIAELEQEAAQGEKIAVDLMGKLPGWLKKLPKDVKTKAVEYGTKAKDIGSKAYGKAKDVGKKEYGKAKKDLSDAIYGYDRKGYQSAKKNFPGDSAAQRKTIKENLKLKGKDRAMAALKTMGRGAAGAAAVGGAGYGAKKAID